MVKLFITGYPADIQDVEIIEIISIHGIPISIDLIRDKATGLSKGFGFIEMNDQAGADRAVEAVNGMVIRGRKIKLKPADIQQARQRKPERVNHFPTPGVKKEVTGQQERTKRPRKLVSDTFRSTK